MHRFAHRLRISLLWIAGLLGIMLPSGPLFGQAGLRESLERLDRNQDGEISPNEITALSRPYLERITRARRLSLDRSNSIEQLQEAARIYYALQNGVRDENVRPDRQGGIQRFGPERDQPLIPEFGLAEVKYPYIEDDLDEADQTLRRSDRNGDGFLDRSEASRAHWTHRDPFESDLNKDDRLSRLELAQRYARRRLLSSASGELMKKAWRTGNGIRPVTREREDREGDSDWWRRRGSNYWLTASILGRFDANRNGRLELNETQSLGIPFGQIDIDRDGTLSRDELHPYLATLQEDAGGELEGLPGWFFELDANRDGQIEMAEFTSEWTEEKLREFSSFDANGDGLLTAAEAFQSKAAVGGSYRNENAEVLPPKKTIISEIVVDEDYVIADLNVQLSITHTHVSYLDAYLTGPDGHRVELFADIGSSGDHFDETILDDQAETPITKARPPYKGRYMPGALAKKQPGLSRFNGTNIQGVWQLVIRCTRSDRFGMLHNWGLLVKPEESLQESEPVDSSENDPASGERREGSWGDDRKDGDRESKASPSSSVGARILAAADKNKDGVLTIDEYSEKDRQQFGSADANGDGRVDAGEIEAAIRRLKAQ